MNPLLQVHAANAAIEASGVPKASFDSVCVGNVLSSSAVDTAYISRYGTFSKSGLWRIIHM